MILSATIGSDSMAKLRNLAIPYILLALVAGVSFPQQPPSTFGWKIFAGDYPGPECPEPGDTSNNACLFDGAFEIETHWGFLAPDGGRTTLLAFSENTVLGHYGNPSNIEVVVKVLDGCSINAHFWVYIGTLTDKAQWIEVRDHQDPTRRSARMYFHPGDGPVGTLTDSRAFPCRVGHELAHRRRLRPSSPWISDLAERLARAEEALEHQTY